MSDIIKIGNHTISEHHPTYFIADIAANHNGKLDKAKVLIELAKEAGANAAKFQHFRAEHIVSKQGFETMGTQQSHQAKWGKSVFNVYQDASVPWDWTQELKKHCDAVGIGFFSAPYDFETVDMLDPFVPAYKIGSGDINWPEMLKRIAKKRKPVLLATGASDIGEVQQAVQIIRNINPNLILMQCNTNYTGNLENFKYVSLNVLKTYRAMWPDMILGLSDHTPGHATVLGAIALGARVIEKHFTDDRGQEGPDHAFSMTPEDWQEMVIRARELETAMGNSVKKVEDNEKETVFIQRRCLRARNNLPEGHIVQREDIEVLRPATPDSLSPPNIAKVIGRTISKTIQAGEHFTWDHL